MHAGTFAKARARLLARQRFPVLSFPSSFPRRLLGLLMLNLFIAGTWMLSEKLSRFFSVMNEPSSTLWWPSGFSVAVTFLFGYKVLPGIALASYVFNDLKQMGGATIWFALSDTLEAFFAVYLWSLAFGTSNPLRRAKSLIIFFLLVAVIPTLLSSSIGWVTGRMTQTWIGSPYQWLWWWLENMLGIIVIATAIIAVSREPKTPLSVSQTNEAILLLLVLLIVGGVVFGGWFPTDVKDYPIEFFCTPILIWAAFRFGPLGSSLTVVILSMLCMYGTSRGYGPFVRANHLESIHLMQSYLATNAVLALLVATVVNELVRARLSLSRSNKELEKFAYLASHDLQEPLRTISNFCTLIDRRWGPVANTEVKEYLSLVTDAAKRMHFQINSFLEYARVGRVVNFQKVDCNEIVEMASQNLRATIVETGAKIQIGKLPVLVADRQLMLALFQNLLANAIHFRQTGQAPEIKISAERRRAQWYFMISDNGVGIEKPYHERIFRLFERVNSAERPGTGLGLAVCKRIVEEHQGKIWVESVAGAGSKFTFYLATNLLGNELLDDKNVEKDP
jgi:signal transduction histidine kinase